MIQIEVDVYVDRQVVSTTFDNQNKFVAWVKEQIGKGRLAVLRPVGLDAAARVEAEAALYGMQPDPVAEPMCSCTVVKNAAGTVTGFNPSRCKLHNATIREMESRLANTSVSNPAAHPATEELAIDVLRELLPLVKKDIERGGGLFSQAQRDKMQSFVQLADLLQLGKTPPVEALPPIAHVEPIGELVPGKTYCVRLQVKVHPSVLKGLSDQLTRYEEKVGCKFLVIDQTTALGELPSHVSPSSAEPSD